MSTTMPNAFLFSFFFCFCFVAVLKCFYCAVVDKADGNISTRFPITLVLRLVSNVVITQSERTNTIHRLTCYVILDEGLNSLRHKTECLSSSSMHVRLKRQQLMKTLCAASAEMSTKVISVQGETQSIESYSQSK